MRKKYLGYIPKNKLMRKEKMYLKSKQKIFAIKYLIKSSFLWEDQIKKYGIRNLENWISDLTAQHVLFCGVQLDILESETKQKHLFFFLFKLTNYKFPF